MKRRRERRKYLLVYTADDETELPLIVTRSIGEMARKLGLTPTATASAFNHAIDRDSKNSRFKKVFFEDDEWEDDMN